MSTAHPFFPPLGFGLGLRPAHYASIFEHRPAVDWFEIISENFMDTDGRPKRNLARIREDYPVVMHGVAMSIGTVDPLNSEYLTKLKALADWLEPAWISDHLCWTGVAHKHSHDLLPVPYTDEALKHIISRIIQVQDYLGRPIALENPSTYLEFRTSHIPEAEFIAQMAKQSGCHLLLDVNNVYVSCYNHRLDAKAYIDALPLDRVVQMHLSGHRNMGTHIIDTHDDAVADPVWALYQYVVHRAGRVPNTMIEWDDHIPEWDVLYAELSKAKAAAQMADHYPPLPDLARPQPHDVTNSITPLRDAQWQMQEAILHGQPAAGQADIWIRAKEQFAPADQLAVYTNAYRYRLYDAVAEDYAVLNYYLGDEKFNALLWDVISQVHSTHFNVARYATHLPAFLATHPSGNAFAHELATLENALAQLADAPETPVLEASHLAGMTPETLMELVLNPRAALQLLAFDYPVNRYYQAVQDDAAVEAPTPEASYLAIFRHEDVVWRMDLAALEYQLLQKLFGGATISDALDAVQSEGDAPQDNLSAQLSDWFARWMRNGLLAAPTNIVEQPERNIA